MNHPLVVFRIDASHHSPVHFKGCAYIRIGTSKTNLHGHLEKERKIWLKTREFKFEKGLTDKNLSAIEVLHLLDYPTYYRLLELPVPKGQETILEKFIEEKLIQRSESGYAITNLGAILFATSLKSFDSLSRKAIRLVLYKGKSRLETIKEQQGDRGYAVGIEGLIQFITDILPSNEEIGKVFRKKVSLYPPIAIRELVVNALIHQDFSIRGTGPLIEIFDDRIEISNPGKPLIDTLRFIDHAPQSRNESLASFMRRINLCEERGSGIDKVVSSCEIYQLPAPNFIAEELFTKVILYAPKTLREMDKLDKIRACYQHCVLKYVANDFMTNKTLRERLNVDENNYPMVSRIIADTANSGLIKDYDPNNRSKKYSKYVPFWV